MIFSQKADGGYSTLQHAQCKISNVAHTCRIHNVVRRIVCRKSLKANPNQIWLDRQKLRPTLIIICNMLSIPPVKSKNMLPILQPIIYDNNDLSNNNIKLEMFILRKSVTHTCGIYLIAITLDHSYQSSKYSMNRKEYSSRISGNVIFLFKQKIQKGIHRPTLNMEYKINPTKFNAMKSKFKPTTLKNNNINY
ncbi:hypothetical protein AGLY_004955 [Aphis glycines]|uniref:Uncharacterized protein n=1 Tax=Aphis glycines TaxID=307491 RepID=A0A6G0TXS3_APHGL|nr:hypothetical protein AGLY_004955 [Aphis glycines]